MYKKPHVFIKEFTIEPHIIQSIMDIF